MRKLMFLAVLLVPSVAFATIVGTPHDLSNATGGGSIKAAASALNEQVCVYCHVPHGAQNAEALWSRPLDTSTTITWGRSLTIRGTSLVDGAPSNATARCLSCHDGTVALGDLTGSVGVSVAMSDPQGHLTGDMLDTSAGGKYIPRTNFGRNHPVGIPYAGEAGYLGHNSGVAAVTTEGYYNHVGGVITNGAGDRIRLSEDPNTAGVYGLECATCHDPHSDVAPKFLPFDNAGSAVCLTCHNK
ncbi:MAG: cytochrome c3 family protein [Deltaproteobacteria bacterium]|nr:cytochrome c3 family protein [Deltaproteobacteria bacterium]